MAHLFGGAITASIPSTWRDVSQVRQVPDNQEVFQDCTEETGAVLVIEILEHQIDVTNSDACAYFLKDLADSNEASSLHIVEFSHVIENLHHDDDNNNGEMEKMTWFPNLSIPASSSSKNTKCCACIARGSQKVVRTRGDKEGSPTSKNNDDATSHWIDVEICVLRLPRVQTDLLITLSTPQHEQIIICDTTVRSEAEDGEDSVSDDHQYYGYHFQQILKTLNINDWSLFAS